MSKYLKVPVFSKDDNGDVLPNVIFHRSNDKLHSRCIEYPFCASYLETGQKLLDLGSAKSDLNWVHYLNSIQAEVHCSDYDEWSYDTDNIIFHQSDIRSLPFPSDTFDKVVAVSVLEHIGLEKPQVRNIEKPKIDESGDIDAFVEMLRVTKSGGYLIITVPFGVNDGLIFNGESRNYTIDTIKKFNRYANPVDLKYFEYQYKNSKRVFVENQNIISKYIQKIKNKFSDKKVADSYSVGPPIGTVTWRCVPMETAKAKNRAHVDGVLCGVWEKT